MSIRRPIPNLGVGLAVLMAGLLATFAMPVRSWRTGEQPAPPLSLLPQGALPHHPRRVWIDTDAACGEARRTDPDDCLAILLVAGAEDLSIVGLSTTFGNASLDQTDRTTRALAAVLTADGHPLPTVHRGSAARMEEGGTAPPAPAHQALRTALEQGPLTVLALGPLTNLAAALTGRPELAANVASLVAVMGRRPGHLFHPAEGRDGGILFGHGPVFRDFNLAQDSRAAADALAMGLPTILIPYEAARTIQVTKTGLDRMSARGGASAWVAKRARAWLDYWREDIGTQGFYPFDLLAAAYVLDPEAFRCARVRAWVGKDPTLFIPFWKPTALLVAQGPVRIVDPKATGSALYCSEINSDLETRLRARF